MAVRFGQTRFVEDFSKDSLEIIIQRIADLRAEASLAKGAGKGSDEQMG